MSQILVLEDSKVDFQFVSFCVCVRACVCVCVNMILAFSPPSDFKSKSPVILFWSFCIFISVDLAQL